MINALSRNARKIAWIFYFLFSADMLIATPSAPHNSGIPKPRTFAGNTFSREPIAKESPAFPNWHSDPGHAKSDVPLNIAIRRDTKKVFGGGPTQPEMQAFQSVNANNMVDLFSGDFSYNIPLMDVGGYPINIAYRSGISMDQEASWVGLGWNINPGTITRNMRGLPDDFDGRDTVQRVSHLRPNTTIGVTAGGDGDVEIAGFPLPLNLGMSSGIFYNNYRGWGIERGLNASLNSGSGSKDILTGGLGLQVNDNSADGLSLTPSFSLSFNQYKANENTGFGESFSVQSTYSSRSGVKALQLSSGTRQFDNQEKDHKHNYSNSINSTISFASPTVTPSVPFQMTSSQSTFTLKLGIGTQKKVVHPSVYIKGYVSEQRIADVDTLVARPAFGYLHFQDATTCPEGLLDCNREKELPYRENPTYPHIAVPYYTYDAFSITGEGTGGMFRPYRSDIGFVHDAYIRTKDNADRLTIDVGIGDVAHQGFDLNLTRAFTEDKAWLSENSLAQTIAFKKDSGLFQSAYFRNPGEKSINSKNFYQALGGDDLVRVKIHQDGSGSSQIEATNYLTPFHNGRPGNDLLLKKDSAFRRERDKRSQVITYLTADEADAGALSKYIDNYTPNMFSLTDCAGVIDNEAGNNTGLVGEYFPNMYMRGVPYIKRYDTIGYDWQKGGPDIQVNPGSLPFPVDTFSIRWTGRIQAPVTGRYIFTTWSDDGVRVMLNDTAIINYYADHALTVNSDTVNLVAGEFYKLKVEYYEKAGKATMKLFWAYPGSPTASIIPRKYLYPPAVDTFAVSPYLVREKRVNQFRKGHHISEIDVLNTDGKRYVYGIPVYNLMQREATFAIPAGRGNVQTGLTGYTPGVDNTAYFNRNGKDWYYNSQTTPAYAHSFLLTGIVSADYVDVTGNGISDDDIGDAVKFKYSKICGLANPYGWRAPFAADSATYNEGFKTESRDDKASYIYGQKELWYMHSIESKTMIATFTLQNRTDLFSVDEVGHRIPDSLAKCLKQIDLYSKADFIKNGINAIPVKTVHFEYSYELCPGVNRSIDKTQGNTGKLTLKRIWFTYNGNDKGKQNPYIFNYNALNPGYNARAYDRWGNYKDPLQNPGSTTASPINNEEYPYALQDSTLAAANAAAWTLDSIGLPSGGSIKVNYESDDYAYVQNRRAMQLFKLVGLGRDTVLGNSNAALYTNKGDNLYVFVRVPTSVSSKQDVYQKYLAGVSKLFFKLFVQMPGDQYGRGYEYVPTYADLDIGNSYGRINDNTIWIKLSGIDISGNGGGSFSALAKSAIQFLRLNLPSKAYPGSEVGDGLSLQSMVEVIYAMGANIVNAFTSFDVQARGSRWCSAVDLTRTYIRLNNPNYKKYGGGHRVKRITIYDNWDKQTQQRAAKYGQEYTYTTQQDINGVKTTISSGVASYEPGIGGEENPFRIPIECVQKVAPLGPTTTGYSEEPLGESIFPAPGIGYSKVRVRTINYKNKRSANGFEETTFYTAYDFPVFTERTLFDENSLLRYKPGLANFFRINAKHYLTLSQGFKVELNDMHGKLRSQAYYPEADPDHYTTYTENIYRVEDPNAEVKKLSNVVSVIKPNGAIDTAALIGKDVELMVDMREQRSVTDDPSLNLNTDLFSVPFVPPLFLIPMAINLAQHEEDQYRSVAVLKVIQRYGILDSVIHVDKGSKVSTRDILYDSETGDVVMTRTQNEFNDPVFSVNYPAHWAYDGMGLAFRNIDLVLPNVTFKSGKLIKGSPLPDSLLFAGGDEVLVAARQRTGQAVCDTNWATFHNYIKLWAVDSSVMNGGRKAFYFVDKDGKPFDGDKSWIKVIRSGRRNINTAVGQVTTLVNPLIKLTDTGNYSLVLNTGSRVISSSAAEFSQYWKVEDRKVHTNNVNCIDPNPGDCNSGAGCTCQCLKKLFDYLIAKKNLFIKESDHMTVGGIVQSAAAAGYGISINDCPLLQANKDLPFYAITSDSIATFYRARIGDCYVDWNNNRRANLYNYFTKDCGINGAVQLSNLLDFNAPKKDTVTVVLPATQLVQDIIIYDTYNSIPANTYSKAPFILSGFTTGAGDGTTIDSLNESRTLVRFDGISTIPPEANILVAKLYLKAAPTQYSSSGPIYPHSIAYGTEYYIPFKIAIPSYNWDTTSYNATYFNPDSYIIGYEIDDYEENLSFDAMGMLGEWRGPGGNRGLLFYSTPGNTPDYYFHTTFTQGNVSDILGTNLTVKYVLPVDLPDSIKGSLSLSYCQHCETITDYSCRSVVSDTTFNPYVAGVLGAWRGNRSYAYYGSRAETDPSTKFTNIRHDGAFGDFTPFWNFQNQALFPQYDSMKWVWNSQLTNFNRKGLEIENKDPLGRYNSIQYGYNLTLPIAVTQNGKFREAAFEGFEDYGFLNQVCDTACPAARHIDFSPYLSKLTTAQKHSGKTSLQVNPGDDVGVGFLLTDQEADLAKLSFSTLINTCGGTDTVLDKIKIPNTILLPTFSPFKGKQMVISAWVKEEQACTCTSYANNAIKVGCTGGSNPQLFTFRPTGNIIEGWQRYEGVFTIPADATALSVSLQATGSTTVYFDDLRIHPFNADMKSFVYNPTNLRLMAELDENNHATFYEYDDDGTLIRVKKETERGIQTIKETRSALLKN